MNSLRTDNIKDFNNIALGTLYLEIFCFDPKADYEFYARKYELNFTQGKESHTQISTTQLLSEILAHISHKSGLSFSPNIELKLNGIALLEDENLSNLLDRFGTHWHIEPLSTLYVKKDLLLDKEAMFKRYEEFFSKCDFILPDEREKLYQYLPLNLVSERSKEYLGDGFFLFIKWLAQRHTKHLNTLLESINDTKNGALAYASIQNLLYKPNPQIDRDIEWLIESIVASNKEMRQHLFNPKQRFTDYATDYDFANLLDSSASVESTYIIFNGYNAHYAKESNELITSCKTLCKKLGITVSNEKIDFIYNGGHFGRICDVSAFVKRTLHNILQANAKGCALLFGDYASFCEARFACQNLINEHPNKDSINAWLKKEPIAYIGDLLATHLHNVSKLDSSVKDSKGEDLALNIVAYTPNSASTLEFLQHSSYAIKIANITNALREKTTSNLVVRDIVRQDFSHLESLQAHSYPQCYLEESARIRFFGIDLGADVLLVDSVEQCYAFKSQASKSAKAYNRDMDNTEAMFLSELALRLLV